MALYSVTRTDDVQPGEFVSAFVTASGTAQARQAVAHLAGVKPRGTNVRATVYRTITPAPVLLSVYWDETPP
ncbi:hypothetical protein [Streptomyces sp. NPDC006638]|uniref:hypothetical protein n=1 Tax=Streptomyces sp. NPDC006638 TaxID=3157183 RepID=UPI0033BBA551